MSKGVEDLQILRLIKAFQKITDQDARRLIILFVEEQLQKQQAKASGGTPPMSARSFAETLDAYIERKLAEE
ncbi:hypothetical protein XI09_30765 [Bradyrhizobium sp. CCBAU 11386]|uniref:hypothetical protein n=1 Tax=Bradyrhizobium sp. CCBAU 11386 TaxID=1630837 RepID=UPI0023031F03|nr:hypothetical protein [Bradyrhizobium sp. CCBAU 11386]MDA9508940.1 hypothetical protein [Bradyrhizobium sp. CCBAU 11386]